MGDKEAERIAAEVAAARLREVEKANKRAVLRQQAQPDSALSPGLIRGARNAAEFQSRMLGVQIPTAKIVRKMVPESRPVLGPAIEVAESVKEFSDRAADRPGGRRPAGPRKIVDLPDDEPPAQASIPERIKNGLKPDEMQRRIDAIKARIRRDFNEWNAAKSFCKGELKRLGFSDESAESYAQDIVGEIFREQGNLQEDTAGSLPSRASYSEEDYKRIIGRIVSFLRLDIQSGYGWEAIWKGIDQSLDEDYPGIDKDRVKDEVFYHYQEKIKELEREQAADAGSDWPPRPVFTPPPGSSRKGGSPPPSGQSPSGQPEEPFGDGEEPGAERMKNSRWKEIEKEETRQAAGKRENEQRQLEQKAAELLSKGYSERAARNELVKTLRFTNPFMGENLRSRLANEAVANALASGRAGSASLSPRGLLLVVETYPVQSPVAINGKRVAANPGSPASVRATRNTTYTVSVEKNIDAPKQGSFEQGSFVFEKWDDGVTSPGRTALVRNASVMLRAYYRRIEPLQRTGTAPGARGVMGMQTLKGRLDTDVQPRKLRSDPQVLAAINKGKRILNRYARIKYRMLFRDVKSVRQVRRDELKSRKRALDAAKAEARRAKDGMSAASEEEKDVAKEVYKQAEENLRQAQLELKQAKDDALESFSKSIESRTQQLAEYLQARADSVAVVVCRKYKIPVYYGDYEEVRGELHNYALTLADAFAARGATWQHAMSRGLGNLSRGAETFTALGGNIFSNLWAFIFGPWTIMTVLVIIQFFFILTFVGYNPSVLYIMPIIAGGFTWILNFSGNFRPFDMITHFMSGAAIGYSAALLLIALGAQKWSFIGGIASFGFWIAWAILAFIGVFQFYHSGGE